MTEDDLRALVRAAVARHLDATPASGTEPEVRRSAAVHVSFHRYALPRAEGETACLIEPAVRCNHCGFCESHGY